jgi:DNA repair protein RadC
VSDPMSPAVSRAARRRREDAAIARAEGILLRRLRRSGRLRNPSDAERFLRFRLAGLLHEELHAIWLDSKHRIIACDVLAKGSLDHASIDPRVVVQLALERNARASIIAHNHPSGVAEASVADIDFTTRVREALGLFSVDLLEHFVVGEGAAAISR